MNTNKSENNAEEDSDEVIYDLTTDFRAASRALGEIYIWYLGINFRNSVFLDLDWISFTDLILQPHQLQP